MSKKKFDFDNFMKICERTKKELGIEKDKQLIEIIETTQPTFSRRKAEDNFSIEWAYSISIKTGLLVHWILTGRGHKTVTEGNGDEFFNQLQKWGKESGGSENISWLKNQIDHAFPMFKEWRVRREKGEGSEANSIKYKVA